MFVPEPVISLSITPKNSKETANFSKAINRFQREDPTFRCHVDPESQQTIISGMGELHLDIYVERMRREYNVDCITGKPEVAYRETVSERVEFDHTLKKQTGGAGDYARVMGWLGPMGSLSENKFEEQIIGGHISEKFLFACEKVYSNPPTFTLAPHPTNPTRASLNPAIRVLSSATRSSEHTWSLTTAQRT